MPGVIDIVVQASPALLRPLPPQEYLHVAMETAVGLVRDAAERNLNGGKVRPSGRPRRVNKPGYGPLLGSVTTTVVERPGAVVGHIRSRVFYGRFLETGAKAHPIEAEQFQPLRPGESIARPGMLAFGSASAPIYRRKVKHPGLAPRYWMRSAAEAQAPAVTTLIEDQVRAWARAAGGQLQVGRVL